MVIILCLYIVALWVVFSRFKLVRWGWLSGTEIAVTVHKTSRRVKCTEDHLAGLRDQEGGGAKVSS
jgi:hypothetical protein